jgi:hypothetical protein
VLLSLVVLEAETVIERHVVGHCFRWDGGHGVILVPDIYLGYSGIVQCGL